MPQIFRAEKIALYYRGLIASCKSFQHWQCLYLPYVNKQCPSIMKDNSLQTASALRDLVLPHAGDFKDCLFRVRLRPRARLPAPHWPGCCQQRPRGWRWRGRDRVGERFTVLTQNYSFSLNVATEVVMDHADCDRLRWLQHLLTSLFFFFFKSTILHTQSLSNFGHVGWTFRYDGKFLNFHLIMSDSELRLLHSFPPH